MSSESALPSADALPPRRADDTRDRLLDAAERLFAERGFEGASMRAVTQAAGSSVSAANYHFGSKEALLRAVLERQIEPVNREREIRLHALLERAEPPVLEEVLDAFLRPAFEAPGLSGDPKARYRQVAARLYADPPELVAELKRDLFGQIAERTIAAALRALPRSSEREIAFAFQFTVGVMVHVISGHLDGAPGIEHIDDDELLDRLAAYCAGGIRAACAAGGER